MTSYLACPHCSNQTPLQIVFCRTCGRQIGFPNVIYAKREEEQSALGKRYQQSIAQAGGNRLQIDAFADEVAKSRVVIGCKISLLEKFTWDDQFSYASYHRQVSSGGRHPEDNKYDPHRSVYEGAINPGFHEDIIFGLLSLNESGDPYYGHYFLIIKDDAISHRTTFIEEDAYKLCQNRGIVAGNPPPMGIRAAWEDRGTLAGVKLGSQLQATMTAADYPDLLVRPSSSGDSDYIEAHVYGSIHVSAVEKVIAVNPKSRREATRWNGIKRRLRQRGIVTEER